MNDFREGIKVQEDKLNRNNEIIKKLNELEKIYNPNSHNLVRRTQVLRSGENVFYNTMLMAGMLFQLRDKTKGIVDAHVIGRVKSIESIERKKNRKGREKKENQDIIAYNMIIDRVHNSENFINVFQSNKIQGLYNERKSNLDIMNMAVEFIKSFEIYEISSELDESLPIEKARDLSSRRLDEMKKNCDTILENIKIYDKEDKVLSNEFPVKEYMQVMCEDLLQKEIEKAKNSLYLEKERLVETLKDKENSEEFITKMNLRNIKSRIKLLESKKVWKTQEITEVLSGFIDKEKTDLYMSILEHLKIKEIEGLNEENKSNEKIYTELIILILYQLTKLEFTKEGQYQGLIYNNIWMNLHNQLKEYKNSEIDKGSYRNITFESLQKLITNLIRLNARLSDTLQYEISKYEMTYHLDSIIEIFKEMELPEGDEKLKSNGYVAIHYDMVDVELKTTTHYRDRVSTYGSAAYGNGRIENNDEKKREIKRLDYKKYLFHAKRAPIIKQAEINGTIKKRNFKN